MSLTLTSPAQTAQVVVTLQLHWTQNSREVPEKPTRDIKVFKPFYGSLRAFSIVRFPFKGWT